VLRHKALPAPLFRTPPRHRCPPFLGRKPPPQGWLRGHAWPWCHRIPVLACWYPRDRGRVPPEKPDTVAGLHPGMGHPGRCVVPGGGWWRRGCTGCRCLLETGRHEASGAVCIANRPRRRSLPLPAPLRRLREIRARGTPGVQLRFPATGAAAVHGGAKRTPASPAVTSPTPPNPPRPKANCKPAGAAVHAASASPAPQDLGTWESGHRGSGLGTPGCRAGCPRPGTATPGTGDSHPGDGGQPAILSSAGGARGRGAKCHPPVPASFPVYFLPY